MVLIGHFLATWIRKLRNLTSPASQKTHTIKNTIICDEYQFIHFLEFTWRGAIHDKSMIEIELPDFNHPVFDKQTLLKDTGCQAYNPKGIKSLQPMKKKKKIDFTVIQKKFNTWISSYRVVVENAIGGVKYLRVLTDRTRGFNLKKSDLAIKIGVGLHNFRVTRRQTTYSGTLDRMRANFLS
ncbi:MAG: transposase family protein [Saprospiraceae bacterium]